VVTQHYQKEAIEKACLNEAKAWFTQANDTPFLSEPLAMEIHWLGIHLQSFDQIATGEFIPPQNTPEGASQLLLLLTQPADCIMDQPTNLSAEQHKQG